MPRSQTTDRTMTKSLKIAVIVAAAVLGVATVGQAYADGLHRHVTLINRSHRAISEFHASNIQATTWEEDILGHTVLLPGQSVVINLSDGTGQCRFDFKTVTKDGTTVYRRGINVCETSSYTITD
jgi:hypothetical protein